MKVVLFAGFSNSGKTTAIAALTKALTKKGRKVGTIKHISHPSVDFDVEGKDTWVHYTSGAAEVVGMSYGQIALFKRVDHPETHIDEILKMLQKDGMEYVLVEGLYEEFAERKGVTTALCVKSVEDARELLKTHGRAVVICGKITKDRSVKSVGGIPVVDPTKDTARALKLIE